MANRRFIAWVGGIAVFILLTAFFQWLEHQIGLPLEYNHNGPDELRHSSFGYCTMFITLMLAIRAGILIDTFPDDDFVSQEDNIKFFSGLLGLTILAVLMALIDLAFRETYSKLADFIKAILQISVVGGVWWSMKALHDKKLEKLKRSEEEFYIRLHGASEASSTIIEADSKPIENAKSSLIKSDLDIASKIIEGGQFIICPSCKHRVNSTHDQIDYKCSRCDVEFDAQITKIDKLIEANISHTSYDRVSGVSKMTTQYNFNSDMEYVCQYCNKTTVQKISHVGKCSYCGRTGFA